MALSESAIADLDELLIVESRACCAAEPGCRSARSGIVRGDVVAVSARRGLPRDPRGGRRLCRSSKLSGGPPNQADESLSVGSLASRAAGPGCRSARSGPVRDDAVGFFTRMSHPGDSRGEGGLSHSRESLGGPPNQADELFFVGSRAGCAAGPGCCSALAEPVRGDAVAVSVRRSRPEGPLGGCHGRKSPGGPPN